MPCDFWETYDSYKKKMTILRKVTFCLRIQKILKWYFSFTEFFQEMKLFDASILEYRKTRTHFTLLNDKWNDIYRNNQDTRKYPRSILKITFSFYLPINALVNRIFCHYCEVESHTKINFLVIFYFCISIYCILPWEKKKILFVNETR